jgi:hypothetical protein
MAYKHPHGICGYYEAIKVANYEWWVGYYDGGSTLVVRTHGPFTDSEYAKELAFELNLDRKRLLKKGRRHG